MNSNEQLTPDFDLIHFKLGELASFIIWMLSNLTRAGALFSQSGLEELKIHFKSAKNSNTATEASIQHDLVIKHVNCMPYSQSSVLKLFFEHLNVVIQGYTPSGFGSRSIEKTIERVAREAIVPYLWPNAKVSTSAIKILSILIRNPDDIMVGQPPALSRRSSITSIRRVSGNTARSPFQHLDSSSLINNPVKPPHHT
jgi:hypothetical protein